MGGGDGAGRAGKDAVPEITVEHEDGSKPSLMPAALRTHTPSSASKRLSDTVRSGVLGRKTSWVGMHSLLQSRSDKHRHGGGGAAAARDAGKGAGDGMGAERRERLAAHMRKAGHLDHLGLRHFPSLVDTLRSKEKGMKPAGWGHDGGEGAAKHKCTVLFSARNANVVRKTEQRAVCVTERAVHLLAVLPRIGLDTAKTGNYRVLHTFDLSSLVTIIESDEDPLSVCLDFRLPRKDAAADAGVADRTSVLQKLPDASYVIFAFKPKGPEKERKEKEKAALMDLDTSRTWFSTMRGHSPGGDDAARAALTDKDEFVATLYLRFWPVPPEKAERPKAELAVLKGAAFRSMDDAQRAISKVLRKGQLESIEGGMVSLIPATENDKLHVAQNARAVECLRAEGDRKIMFSCEVETLNRYGKVKAALACLLTDRALYYTDRQHFDKIVRRVELQHLDQIFLDAGVDADSPDPQWATLIRVDLASDRSTKDFSSDLLYQVKVKAVRDLFARTIQASYEDLVISKLDVEEGVRNVRTFKRGKLEAWLSSLQSSGKQKLLMDRRTEESLRWLVFLLKHKLRVFLSLLTEILPMNDTHLFARSFVSLCEGGGLTEELLADVVNVEMDANSSTTTFFRGKNLTTAILKVYVFGTERERNVEEYLRIVLLDVLDRFDRVNPNIEVQSGPQTAAARQTVYDLWKWMDLFYGRITSQQSADCMPVEMRRVVQVIYTACQERKLDPYPYVGGYLLLRVFGPAITTPHQHNLMKEPNAVKVRKLLLIARLLQHTANKMLLDERREPGAAQAMNWWLRKYGGGAGMANIAPPKEYAHARQSSEAYAAFPVPQLTWTEYVDRLVHDGSPGDVSPRSGRALEKTSMKDIEGEVERRDFMDDWSGSQHVLASMHTRLTMYTEQVLSMLWTSIGAKKKEMGDLKGELDMMEEDAGSGTGTNAASPLTGDSSPASPTAHAHPRALRAKNDLFNRRATMWDARAPEVSDSGCEDEADATESTAHTGVMHTPIAFDDPPPPRRKSKAVPEAHAPSSTVTTQQTSPRRNRPSRAFQSRPAAKPTLRGRLNDSRSAERSELRERQEYLAYLREVLDSKDAEETALLKERAALDRRIEAFT
eukprot:TRINITY_DN1109_c0_g5_i1.p1 TRINITY_DN1109_c0_g5~~TRINITY_DN1109_c0_g5_i1.p1  ORF type:complete len:1115 (+),score=413.62 TRINITY_DN1109_c0_g5_i1:75-3419(+)